MNYDEVERRIVQILIDYGLMTEATGPQKKFIQDKSFVPFTDK